MLGVIALIITMPLFQIVTTVQPKSDLPKGWEEKSELPPGSIRLEDIKPGMRPKPQQLDLPPAQTWEPERGYPAKPVVKKKQPKVETTIPPAVAPEAPAAIPQPAALPTPALPTAVVPTQPTTAPVLIAPTAPTVAPVAPVVQPPPVVVAPPPRTPNAPSPFDPITTEPPKKVTKPSGSSGQYHKPAVLKDGRKSDLPAGWEEETTLPANVVRIEDLKSGTKPKEESKPEPKLESKPEPKPEKPAEVAPIAVPEPITTVVPWTPPAKQEPAKTAPPTPTYKSDLPKGWDEPTQLPPGAVRLEDLKK